MAGINLRLNNPGMLLILAITISVIEASNQEQNPYSYLPSKVTIRGLNIPWNVTYVSVMPLEKVDIQAPGYFFRSEGGKVEMGDKGKWFWQAPTKHGTYSGYLEHPQGRTVKVNFLVKVPASKIKNGRLNGYLIGKYPSRALRGSPVYKSPEGFIEVTGKNKNLQVSPHFQLGDFLCKQSSDWPKYVLLREALVFKLEGIVDDLNKEGFKVSNVHVMSGYRTPAYNRSIGSAKFSAHMYGAAADIYIDQAPKDGYMDDLTGDNKINIKDAVYLHDLIDKRDWGPFKGGLGKYRANSVRGPFVHVDVRGWRARW